MSKLELKFSTFAFTEEEKHSNLMRWEGAVTKIGVPSDGVPCGAEYPVVFTKEAVEASYQTLNNTPLNCVWPEWWGSPEWLLTGHDPRFVIGSVLDTWIDGEYLMAKGVIYKDNFRDVATMIRNAKDALGFSVEVNVRKIETKEDLEYASDIEFMGLCVCFSNVAAFSDTFITQLAASKKKKEGDILDENKLAEIISKIACSVEEKLKPIEDEVAKIKAEKAEKEAAEKARLEAAAKEELERLKAEKAELERQLSEAKAKPQRRSLSGYKVSEKFEDGTINFDAEIKKINTSSMSPEQKIKARMELGAKLFASKQAQ